MTRNFYLGDQIVNAYKQVAFQKSNNSVYASIHEYIHKNPDKKPQDIYNHFNPNKDNYNPIYNYQTILNAYEKFA